MDARTSLALWLRAGRAHKGMTLDDVCRITKIQTRILERLESGKADGLPADVFVRGFVRSFAKCVGLDEAEALRRYHACTNPAAAAPVSQPTASARAVVEAMADLAPVTASVTRISKSHEVPSLAAGSLEMRAATSAPETFPPVVVQMLPLTGTLVETAPAAAEIAEVVACASEPLVTAESAVADVAPTVESAPVVADVIVAPPIVADAVADTESSAKSKKKRRGAKRAKRNTQRAQMAVGTPAAASPIVEALAETTEIATTEPTIEAAGEIVAEPVATTSAVDPAEAVTVAELPAMELEPVEVAAPIEAATDIAVDDTHFEEPIATATWQPKMPPLATATSVPWRRPSYATSTAPVVPSLVIDDADPEGAEQVREERSHRQSRRSFLPPILLDREDRSARQGGLTLAVIILLIAATLTLSYLMRRPSSSGDGVTTLPAPTQLVG